MLLKMSMWKTRLENYEQVMTLDHLVSLASRDNSTRKFHGSLLTMQDGIRSFSWCWLIQSLKSCGINWCKIIGDQDLVKVVTN